MTLIERIKSLVSPGARQDAASLAAVVSELSAAHADAQRKHADAQRRQSEHALELVAAGDDEAINGAHRELAALASKIQLIGQALATARAKLGAVQQANEAAATAQAWDAAEKLLEQHQRAALRVQAAATELAKAHAVLLNASQAAWQALPTKPMNRPGMFTAGGLDGRLQLFLYGASEGRLGRGTNVHVAQTHADLAQGASEAALMLLAQRPRATAEPQESAA